MKGRTKPEGAAGGTLEVRTPLNPPVRKLACFSQQRALYSHAQKDMDTWSWSAREIKIKKHNADLQPDTVKEAGEPDRGYLCLGRLDIPPLRARWRGV